MQESWMAILSYVAVCMLKRCCTRLNYRVRCLGCIIYVTACTSYDAKLAFAACDARKHSWPLTRGDAALTQDPGDIST